MKLVCTINGAEVEATEEAAKALVASGSFAPKTKPKAAKPKAQPKEA